MSELMKEKLEAEARIAGRYNPDTDIMCEFCDDQEGEYWVAGLGDICEKCILARFEKRVIALCGVAEFSFIEVAMIQNRVYINCSWMKGNAEFDARIPIEEVFHV